MRASILLLHAFVLVVKAVIGAVTCVARKEIAHVVLVQGYKAHVCVVFFVVIVKFAALAISLLAFILGCHEIIHLSLAIIIT